MDLEAAQLERNSLDLGDKCLRKVPMRSHTKLQFCEASVGCFILKKEIQNMHIDTWFLLKSSKEYYK